MPPQLSERYTAAVERARVYSVDLPHLDGRSPYLAHLLAISSLVLQFGGSEDEAIAALVRESAVTGDRFAALDTIRESFGPEIARLVESTLNPVLLAGADASVWKRRMAPTIDRIKHEKDAAAFRISVAEQAQIAAVLSATRYDDDTVLPAETFAPSLDDAWWFLEAVYRAIRHTENRFARDGSRNEPIVELVALYASHAELLLDLMADYSDEYEWVR